MTEAGVRRRILRLWDCIHKMALPSHVIGQMMI